MQLYAADPQVGALAATLEAAVRDEEAGRGDEEGGGERASEEQWRRLRAPLQELFSIDGERRREASRAVAEELQEASMGALAHLHLHQEQGQQHMADPFRVRGEGLI